jgi:hypothetical protein
MKINIKHRHLKTFNRSFMLIIILLILGLGGASASPLEEREWLIQTVDIGENFSNDVGEYSSIALDLQDVPHISYYDLGNGDLRFASWEAQEIGTAGIWRVETVDWNGNVGKYSSLAIDHDGMAHISYYDDSAHDLKYARQLVGGGWLIETVDDSISDVGRYSSLNLDAAGYPHISYYEAYPNYDLKYAFYNGSEWVLPVKSVDESGNVGQFTSLALDSNGYPHVSYFDATLMTLNYAHKTTPPSIPGDWSYHALDMGQDQFPGGNTSLALDRQDVPHIAFIQQSGLLTPTFALNYASWDSMWQSDTVATWGDNSGQVSLALDRFDRPHIAFYDGGEEVLKYAYLSFDGWQIEMVDLEGDVGSYPSISLSRFGLPHISYRNNSTDEYDLKYATLPYILRQEFLPYTLREWVRYFTRPFEQEDNDAAWQANGALIFGQEYIGYHNDEDDFFSVYPTVDSTLTIDLDTDHLEQDDSGYYVVQLILYSGSASPENRVGWAFSPPYHIEYSGSPGWYYVRVYTAPGYLDGSKEYRLTVTTP